MTDICRLCGGESKRQFVLRVLGKYDVEYNECVLCESLQTEPAYWLDEAYGASNAISYDTGAAQRNINNLATCFIVSKLFNAKNVIDIGGGDGLLCRMLRDRGVNCFVKDKYASLNYSKSFTDQNFSSPNLVIGFEVLEHFPNPSVDLNSLFEANPKLVLLTTQIYSKNNSSWWYLVPEGGQHIFFYTTKALRLIAKKYNYQLVLRGGYALYMKKNSLFQKIFLNILLASWSRRLLVAFVMLFPTPGIWVDHEHIRAKLK